MVRICNEKVLVLQSGGRDSTIAAMSLLEQGFDVMGITLAKNAGRQIDLPRRRAVELATKYPGYRWGMVDFSEWDSGLKNWVADRLTAPLPKSCLLCALTKITSVIGYCKANDICNLSLGYVAYQDNWAEQTPLAIKLQSESLALEGLSLLLPARSIAAKDDAKKILSAQGLTADSLENPCCISTWGTQPVPDNLIRETIALAFEYYSANQPRLRFVDRVGGLIK